MLYTNLSYDKRFLIKYTWKMKLHIRYSYKPYSTDMGQISFLRATSISDPKYEIIFKIWAITTEVKNMNGQNC